MVCLVVVSLGGWTVMGHFPLSLLPTSRPRAPDTSSIPAENQMAPMEPAAQAQAQSEEPHNPRAGQGAEARGQRPLSWAPYCQSDYREGRRRRPLAPGQGSPDGQEGSFHSLSIEEQ